MGSPESLDTPASQECRGTQDSVEFPATRVTAASPASLEPIPERVGTLVSRVTQVSAVTQASRASLDIQVTRVSLVTPVSAGCLVIQATPELAASVAQIRVRRVIPDSQASPDIRGSVA